MANEDKHCNDHLVAQDTPETFRVSEIQIHTLPIFNENADDSIALHKWANALHIITRPEVIETRLPFQQGDTISLEDVVEAEAILRRERYLADATISVVHSCSSSQETYVEQSSELGGNKRSLEAESVPVKIVITTYDNWSLQPTLSFSRSGGENRSIVGIREDNLLGLGIRAQFRYNRDEQRTGYDFSFSSIAPFMRHATMYLNLSDNDDGERYQFIFNKPFYHVADDRMFYLEGLTESRADEIFQNGRSRNLFEVENSRIVFSTGWKVRAGKNVTNRLTFGIALIDTEFNNPRTALLGVNNFLPHNRNYQYPFIAFSHVTRDIKVFSDVRLIQQPEDINLGLEYQLTFGLETNDVQTSNNFGYHLNANISKAFSRGEDLLFFRAWANAIMDTTAEDYMRLDAVGEYFTRQTPQLAYYARVSATLSKGQFLDQPIVIDDDSGVRGYPNQYQHGDQRISASVEARYYTNYSFYQLFNLGYAAYLDAGRAYQGQASKFNEIDKTLASAGLGLRVYSNKSSTPGVVHLDVTKPLVSGTGVDNYLLSVQLRRGF